VVQCLIATVREILDQSPCPPTLWRGNYLTEEKNATQREDLAMERIVIVSILSALLVQLTAARATAEGNYKKICRVSENLRVLDDTADDMAGSPKTLQGLKMTQNDSLGRIRTH